MGKETNPMTGPRKKDKAAGGGKRKKPVADPTKDAPFRIDPDSGDLALPRNDLSEEELKELEDRRR